MPELKNIPFFDEEEDSLESTYFRFLTHPDDMIGMLAFSLWYKEWARIHYWLKVKKYDGRKVPETEFTHLIQRLTPYRIEELRKSAEVMMVERYERLAHSIDEKLNKIIAHIQ